MKSWLKWSLVVVAVAAATVSMRMAQSAFETSAIAPAVVTVRPGVTPEVIRVTYFSSDVRCTTCVRIERNFAPELRSGRVAFQVVNLDGPGNAHFVQDYRLISKTVVVSDLARGEEIRWEDLQGRVQAATAWVIVAAGVYLTLSGTFKII